MKFDEMNVEELQARQAEIAGMDTESATTEELEERANELEAIQAELKAREERAAAEDCRHQPDGGIVVHLVSHVGAVADHELALLDVLRFADGLDAVAFGQKLRTQFRQILLFNCAEPRLERF